MRRTLGKSDLLANIRNASAGQSVCSEYSGSALAIETSVATLSMVENMLANGSSPHLASEGIRITNVK